MRSPSLPATSASDTHACVRSRASQLPAAADDDDGGRERSSSSSSRCAKRACTLRHTCTHYHHWPRGPAAPLLFQGSKPMACTTPRTIRPLVTNPYHPSNERKEANAHGCRLLLLAGCCWLLGWPARRWPRARGVMILSRDSLADATAMPRCDEKPQHAPPADHARAQHAHTCAHILHGASEETLSVVCAIH